MSFVATIAPLFDVELFQLEDAQRADALAQATGGRVYCWKSQGRTNWLEAGYSVVDVLALVVLPPCLPDYLDMPDDEIDG